MRSIKVGFSAFVVVIAGAATSRASIVNVFGNNFDLNVINNFYNGLPGVNSSIISGPLDSNDLSGVNLLWAVQPNNSYSASEIAAMSNYLAGGGRIAFMGEHGQFLPVPNNNISAAISALGGHMSIVNDIFDPGFRVTIPGQILPHTLTQGVNSY